MNEPLRVLWLVKGLGRGGAEKLLVDLARTLDKAQVRVDVGYVLAHKNALVAELEAQGARVCCLSEAGPWPVELHRLLRHGHFDVVHTHSPVVASLARVLTPDGTVMVHTEHNVWSRYRLPTRVANGLTAHRNEVIWAVSEQVARSVRPVPRGRHAPDVRVLLHGLAEMGPLPGDKERRTAREVLGLPPDSFVVGTVGNLTPKKNHELLIRSFARLLPTVPGARLVVIGGGPREPYLRALVEEEGLQDDVLLAGLRQDVPRLLPAFDVYAMSSRYEGLSIALLEAMAAGCPPVVTAVGGMPEVVTHEVDGLVVAPDRPRPMAEALTRLAVDAPFRTALGSAARRRAEQFTIQPAADALVAAYTALTKARKGAAA